MITSVIVFVKQYRVQRNASQTWADGMTTSAGCPFGVFLQDADGTVELVGRSCCSALKAVAVEDAWVGGPSLL